MATFDLRRNKKIRLHRRLIFENYLSDSLVQIVVLHGLTGGSQESYVRHLLLQLDKLKWRAVVLNFRGASGSELTVGINATVLIS